MFILMIYLVLFLGISYSSNNYSSQGTGAIKGSFYDFNTFSRINNVVMEINTTPKMRIVINNGYYYLNLSPGCYFIRVYTKRDDTIYEASDVICVKENIKVDYDFLLMPLDSEASHQILESLKSLNLEYESSTSSRPSWETIIFIIAVLIIPIIAIMYSKIHSRIKHQKILSEDPYLKDLVDILKKEKRITQKEITKRLPLSEGKISLMLTQLEDMKLIKKVKKGRTNIIYWKGE